MSSLGFKEKTESRETYQNRETRILRLLSLLKNGPKSFAEILRYFGLSSATVTYDLKTLLKDGLLSAQTERGPHGEFTRYRLTPLGEIILARNIGKDFSRVSIDPVVLNSPHRINSLLGSTLMQKRRLVIPTFIYSSIVNQKWDELSTLLRQWEWNVSSPMLKEWHVSEDFKSKCKTLVEVCVPYNQIMRELSGEEEELFSKVSSALKIESPRVVEIAREIVLGAVVKKAPHFSYTKHARRWFKELRNVLIIEISDKANSASKAKARIKRDMERAGWKGYVAVFFFGLVTDQAIENAIPPPIGTILRGMSAGSFVIGAIADGKKTSQESEK